MNNIDQAVLDSFDVARLAKAKGYAVQARKGKLRFVIAKKRDTGGLYDVQPITAYLSPSEALEIIQNA